MFNQSISVGSKITLSCKNEGKVSWRKRVDGNRELILRAEEGEHPVQSKPASDLRYNITTNLSLIIRDVSESDSGVYYCNAVPVLDLTVMPLKSGCIILLAIHFTHFTHIVCLSVLS